MYSLHCLLQLVDSDAIYTQDVTFLKKVQEESDQEMAQSEKNPTPKPKVGKNYFDN